MRISDWSSDVCSSDLISGEHGASPARPRPQGPGARAPAGGSAAAARQGRRTVTVVQSDITRQRIDETERRIRPYVRRTPMLTADLADFGPAFQGSAQPLPLKLRSEERRVGKECVRRVDLGGRRSLKTKKNTSHNHQYRLNKSTYNCLRCLSNYP